MGTKTLCVCVCVTVGFRFFLSLIFSAIQLQKGSAFLVQSKRKSRTLQKNKAGIKIVIVQQSPPRKRSSVVGFHFLFIFFSSFWFLRPVCILTTASRLSILLRTWCPKATYVFHDELILFCLFVGVCSLCFVSNVYRPVTLAREGHSYRSYRGRMGDFAHGIYREI